MRIVKHWLEKENDTEKIVISKSGNAGDLIDPDYVVIHYTATKDANSAISWFMNTSSNPDRIAAHIVLDYDGTITQLVPFNQKANHAGTSTWDGVDFFNSHSVGIEIVNPGFAGKQINDKVIKASHKHKFWTDKEFSFWYTYKPAQIKALYKICKLLFETYHLVNAVGHDDISPGRKSDPGPAFPWDDFKKNVFGAANNTGNIYKVKNNGVNMRALASTNAAIIKKLDAGYEVGLIETNGQWSRVYLVDKLADVLQKQAGKVRSVKTIGWIFSSLLEPKS